jgi:hypothetical protein
MMKDASPNSQGNVQDEFHEHEISDAAQTLLKAEEIRSNPKLMKHVDLHLKKKKDQITSLEQLRKKYAEAVDEENAEGEDDNNSVEDQVGDE